MKRTTMLTTAIVVSFATCVFINSAHPLSTPQNTSTPVVSASGQRRCFSLDSDLCPGSSWTRGVTLPNLYGQYTVDEAVTQLRSTLDALPSSRSSSDHVRQFLCALYLPPCPAAEDSLRNNVGGHEKPEGKQKSPVLPPPLPLPCRPLCEMAREEAMQGARAGGQGLHSRAGGRRSGSGGWPSDIRCNVFPSDRCYTMADPGEVKYVMKALVASGAGANMRDVNPQSVSSLTSDASDDAYDVQVVMLGTNQILPRRYDLTDLGDPMLFQGWADVQGSGAANDYCRVIGKGKRRFLSCALAGTRGQDHHYVSRLGFDSGHPGTWFMRDVDSDGRDDYCRCSGEDLSSRVVCMKAGNKGFYGSTVQGGSQFTFELPGRQNCLNKPLNPHFGV